MINNSTLKKIVTGTGVTLATIGLAGLSYLVLTSPRREALKQERYWKAAMELYEPIGNGGALAAAHGYLSPQREAMYNRMVERFYEARWEDFKVGGKKWQ